MTMNRLDFGVPFHVTHSNATAASASQAAEASSIHIITDVIASSDKSGAIILVKDGATVVMQAQVGAGNFSHHFETPIICTKGAAATVEIDGTSACKANILGRTITE